MHAYIIRDDLAQGIGNAKKDEGIYSYIQW